MNKESLAKEIGDILDLPRLGKRGEAWKIVNAVTKAITEALYRGEDVLVDGFGIFRVIETPPRRHGCYFFPHLGKGLHTEVTVIPAKKRVKFLPARDLVRIVNGRDDR